MRPSRVIVVAAPVDGVSAECARRWPQWIDDAGPAERWDVVERVDGGSAVLCFTARQRDGLDHALARRLSDQLDSTVFLVRLDGASPSVQPIRYGEDQTPQHIATRPFLLQHGVPKYALGEVPCAQALIEGVGVREVSGVLAPDKVRHIEPVAAGVIVTCEPGFALEVAEGLSSALPDHRLYLARTVRDWFSCKRYAAGVCDGEFESPVRPQSQRALVGPAPPLLDDIRGASSPEAIVNRLGMDPVVVGLA